MTTTWIDRKAATKAATDAVQEAVRRAIEEPGFVMTYAKLAHLLAEVVKHAKQDGWRQAIDEATDAVDIVEHRHFVAPGSQGTARVVATECLMAVAKLHDKGPA